MNWLSIPLHVTRKFIPHFKIAARTQDRKKTKSFIWKSQIDRGDTPNDIMNMHDGDDVDGREYFLSLLIVNFKRA